MMERTGAWSIFSPLKRKHGLFILNFLFWPMLSFDKKKDI